MSRKDFEALALALKRKLTDWRENAAWERGFYDAVNVVIDICAMSNDRFDRERFLAAMKEGKK